MVATFSPHRDAGGTLHLPSHSSIHHVDASSAIRQLRRSLSRSPSKSPSFTFISRAHSPSKTTPYVSSPLSPSRKSNQGNFVLLSTSQQPPVAVPYPTSGKASRPVMRRARTSPRSPVKRVLHASSDQGNSTPLFPARALSGDENIPSTPGANLKSQPIAGNSCSNSPSTITETAFAPKTTLSRIEKRRSGTFTSYAAVSPLKRSDGIMGLELASLESPSAKRRSLLGTAFPADLNIFDNEHSASVPKEAKGVPTVDPEARQTSTVPATPFSAFSSIPRRSSSLRRSTMQQRQSERSLFSRAKAISDGSDTSEAADALNVRPRMSLDLNLNQQDADSMLSSRAATGTPVFALMNGKPIAPHAPHPLSRSVTQSSSGSSLLDDSPTHEPAHKPNRPQTMFNFSKSLPAGAARPMLSRQITRRDSTSSTESFTTPENYKLVRPLPAAFMSTGLISKKNRNAEDPHTISKFNKNMPDTPCKRANNLFSPVPKGQPERSRERSKLFLQSSAAPPSPLNPSSSTLPQQGPFERDTGIFGGPFNSRPDLLRRDSFVSIDGEEPGLFPSPSARHDCQHLIETDFPPTPTKQSFFTSETYRPTVSQIRSLERLSDCNASNAASPLHDKMEQASPHTPHDHLFPPDQTGFSMSNDYRFCQNDLDVSNIPATPTGPREAFPFVGKRPNLSLTSYHVLDVDQTLSSRFDKVELIGTGEFSQVYRVAQSQSSSVSAFSFTPSGTKSPCSPPEKVWAVKKSKHPYSGLRDRERRIREVDILKALNNSDHIISFVDSWEDNGHLYIQTEFCEEGSLDVFLAQVGLRARLDDFRIWKILLELSLGLKQIHDSGFIHLDLKPANILITFEGVLKVADFGMAAGWPAERGIEGEGDREYIGPEILMGRFDKPADIFSLGLIIFEIAGNVELPDNGLSWQKLRNGDMSDVPSLTWSSETSIFRDASGNPVPEDSSFELLCGSDVADDGFGEAAYLGNRKSHERQVMHLARSGELVTPPDFMIDANHEQALDKIVRWMISPEPADRPTAGQVLETYGVQFAASRRRAGATVYEGNWGPADEVLAEDAEMIDV